ncbi:high mobility group protein DSP1-like [Centruroides vittatus]|uniref:high mobility group protein DSP1-like n=1 Tax=Centruroides vittatus TaxID=120091 RepID=UPI0035100BD4
MDGLPLGQRNIPLSPEFDYHHAMAQHAAAVSAANNSSLHSAMAMLPTGLNLSVNAANQGISPGIPTSSLTNSHSAYHINHRMSNPGLSGSGKGKSKSKKPKVNRAGIPAPKRALTAYINFTQWYREELKKAGREIPKIGEFGKECAAKWNAMSDEEKQPFLNAAAKDRERYKQEMAVYKPPRDTNKPKRPGTTFMLFMADLRKEMAGREPEGGVAALAKLGGERWRSMTEEEKRPYIERQNKEKLRYEGLMEEYRRTKGNEGMAPAVKNERTEEQTQESSDSLDSHTTGTTSSAAATSGGNNTTSQSMLQSDTTPVSECSTPSPPAQAPSPSPSSTPTPTISNGMASLPSLSHTSLAMGYAQHSLPNFAHSGGVLPPTPNYNQAHAHSTMPASTNYLQTSGATYNLAHLPSHYNWT